MKYIIMASTHYQHGDWKQPKQLAKVNGEVVLARTIRLLKENGVTDIAVTGNDERFGQCGAPLIDYDSSGHWLNAFYATKEPTCYIFGDVYFSPEAIRTIVGTDTKDIDYFASAPPFADSYSKKFAEPFAFKAVDYIGFRNAIETTKRLGKEGRFKRHPIAWELWQVIKGTELNKIDYTNYIAINDYTSDIDYPADIGALEKKLREVEEGGHLRYVIHTFPTRLWYVEKYLMPSMREQGCEDITVYVDEKREGSLKAHMDSFLQLPDDDGGTWHLQDDVIICKDFRRRTELYNGGIVCGFSSKQYDGNREPGVVEVHDKWFSFPCIRIPNKMARGCAKWVNQYIIGNPVYEDFWKAGKNEDWAFWTYVRDYYKHTKILNLAPNLVDHVDYLIGGSASAKTRETPCRSQYWEDDDLVEALERRLSDALDNN